MENNKKTITETTNNSIKNVSFKSSKDFTKEDQVKLPKVTVKLEKKVSSNKKSVNYLAKFKLSGPNGKSMVIQNYITEVVLELVLHAWGKTLDNKGVCYNVCPIRFSKGSKDEKEYKAYDLFLTEKRRIFNFLTEDEIEFIETFGFDMEFEDRVYFDEEGYQYKPENF